MFSFEVDEYSIIIRSFVWICIFLQDIVELLSVSTRMFILT